MQTFKYSVGELDNRRIGLLAAFYRRIKFFYTFVKNVISKYGISKYYFSKI